MLIPLINAQAQNGCLPLQSAIELVRHWSLFGKVAVTGLLDWPQADLEHLAQSTGGAVELLIADDGRPESSLIELLNQGASQILDLGETVRQRPAGIPVESWIGLPAQGAATTGATTLKRGRLVSLTDPNPEELARLDQLGVDVLVDVELLQSRPNLLADFFQLALVTDRPDGLWPTLIVDEVGLALGLAYSNYESLLDALTHRRGSYWSRSRGGLWVKGLTSGNTQQLIGVRMDCDRDCLRFQVSQDGSGFCHLNTYSCFGYERTIATVIGRLRERCQSSDAGSFTWKLLQDPAMLKAKLLEESAELSEAQSRADVAFEAADVMYFTLVKMLGAGVELNEVHQELARRMTRVIRRKNKLESN